MSTLDLLEERIEELEKHIYGSKKERGSTSSGNSVIENILHANTLISSALKGREQVNTLIKRLPELDSSLYSTLDDGDLQTVAKLKLLLAVENETKENWETIKKIKSLMPVLETDKFKDLPELSQKLDTISLTYLKANEEAEALNKDVDQMCTKYNDILTEISTILRDFDHAITAAELKALASKK